MGLSPGPIGEGLHLVDLELEPATLPAPFDPSAGTAPFRAVPCSLRRLVVAAAGAQPGPESLDRILDAVLAPSGWPRPDTSGLIHAAGEGSGGPVASWLCRTDAARVGNERLTALRAALENGLGRDDARAAWETILGLARDSGDAATERTSLAGLASVAPTGERPALLLQLSALDRAAGDEATARVHAEEARTLAPRDRGATEACLAAAQRDGDLAAVIDLLDRLAVIDPATAGDRLLERARRLAATLRTVEADAGFRDALARLPADRALADEHAAMRRAAPPPAGRLPWSEPLESFAARATDPDEASRALRDAALLARAQGDLASALRAARGAHSRSGDPCFVGELLAELLHQGGSVVEALGLHRQLLADGAPPLAPDSLAARLHALADLAEAAGEPELALASLERLLAMRRFDADLLEWRFRLDPDRKGAGERLLAGLDEVRSPSRRSRLLAGANLEKGVAPEPVRPIGLAFGFTRELRSRVALPGADGATGRLLAILSPWLEPLFPVDLGRCGIDARERPFPAPAPAVQDAFGAAFRALGGRPLALLASGGPGLLSSIENTRPPSVVLGREVDTLPPGALAFLAARAVALAASGWALLGRFAPRDVLILCELASRFAGGTPPPRGMPPGPAAAFLEALERSVPATTRDLLPALGRAAGAELETLDAAAFTSAVEGTASRLALLHAGDLDGALSVLSRLPGAAAPGEALLRPDLDGLAGFAVSDAYLQHRGMLLGWA